MWWVIKDESPRYGGFLDDYSPQHNEYGLDDESRKSDTWFIRDSMQYVIFGLDDD